MDITELLGKLENIEILLQANIENMNRIVAEVNDPKKCSKEAEILTQASEQTNSLSEKIAGWISQEKALIENFRPTVKVTQYNIDLKKPFLWILGAILILVFSCAFTCRFWIENARLKNTDMTFRFLKLRTDLQGSKFRTISEAAYAVEDYYRDHSTYIDSFVISREKELKLASEEAELAKQREADAKVASEEAKKLKQHADSLKRH
jgi:hypothetical protein